MSNLEGVMKSMSFCSD